MIIKSVTGKKILDSRKEKTISVTIDTNIGKFSASAPNGESKGKHEEKAYMKGIEGDIKAIKSLSEYFSKEEIEEFGDLKKIEEITERQIGANSLFALEASVLKAIAKEKKKAVWQIINPQTKNTPRLVGNCVEGGMQIGRAHV